MQRQQSIPQVNNVPLYAQQQQVQQSKQVYAPMSTVGGQQYAPKVSGSTTTGLTSQYQPQMQYAPQQAYQQVPQQQYKPKPASHMSEIDRMLNG
jgi:hypothetical protein